jgi:pimeloyl-ACP methyl ester carboxylesterase/ribosomal protein S18 acetylase RimI-like enzyme
MPNSLDGVILHSHGHRLLGSFFRSTLDAPSEIPGVERRGRPTVLLLHGIPGVEKNYDLAYALRGAGWNVLTFHYRGCWGSEGNYSLPGIVDDIATTLDYLNAHPAVDTRRLAGVGLSLGGWGVVMAAARDREARLRAIVSMNPLVDPNTRPLADAEAAEFASMLNGITPAEVQAQYLALTPLPQVAGKLAGRPTLLLTGDADELFPPSHIQPLADAMPFAEWRRIPGASHTFDDHRPVMVRTVIDWLTRAFSPLPPLPAGFTLRAVNESDHARVMDVMVEWWGGRDIRGLLPRLFFQHFNDTSFIVEKPALSDPEPRSVSKGEGDGVLVAFLIGFISQSEPHAAYIHFVGVHPEHRRSGLGRALYQRFFELARARGAREVLSITAPAEGTGSIAFHTRLGFVASGPIPDHDGPGDGRVTFKKRIG